MIKLLRKRSRSSAKGPKASETTNVDISRVIPGFDTAEKRMPTPAPSDNTETVADTVETEVSAPEPQHFSMEEKYQSWMQRDLGRLDRAWLALQLDDDDTVKFKDLRLAAHDLKGMGTTYGYRAISQLATTLERLLNDNAWRDNFELVGLHISACRAAAQGNPDSGRKIDAVSNSVCNALEAQVERLVGETKLAS